MSLLKAITDRISFRKYLGNPVILILLLFLAIILAYFNIWKSYFLGWDDFIWSGIVHNRSSFAAVIQGFNHAPTYLEAVRIWILDRLFNLNSEPYYWLSIFFHGINTCIIFSLVNLWTHRRSIGFLAAILFAVKFSYFEVITSTSAMEYSFWGIFFLLSITFFGLYLERRKSYLYWISVLAYALLAASMQFALVLPLVLIAYQFTFGLRNSRIRSLSWGDLKPHIPFWVIWIIYLSIQVYLIYQGTSEAISSKQSYEIGLHIFTNLIYLVFLIVPNIHIPAIQNFISIYINQQWINLFWGLSIGLAIFCHLIAIILFWKGSSLVRWGLCLIYLPFLPYLLWNGDFIAAPRYLYLSSIGFSLLLALLIIKIDELLKKRNFLYYRIVSIGLVTIILLANITLIQIRIQKDIENGQLKRAFVTEFQMKYLNVEPATHFYFEVPEAKYTGLQYACTYFFPLQQNIICTAFVSDEQSQEEILSNVKGESVYLLRISDIGINQVYPTDLSDK